MTLVLNMVLLVYSLSTLAPKMGMQIRWVYSFYSLRPHTDQARAVDSAIFLKLCRSCIR